MLAVFIMEEYIAFNYIKSTCAPVCAVIIKIAEINIWWLCPIGDSQKPLPKLRQDKECVSCSSVLARGIVGKGVCVCICMSVCVLNICCCGVTT